MDQASRWSLVAVMTGMLAGSLGCVDSERFNVQNARSHVERLAGAMGSRWTPNDANEKARAYLIETLQLYGFDVRVQEADAPWREAGATTRVANIIAIKPGTQRDAVAIVAHYDSVPWGPGAGDDAIGTAVALEAARVLATRSSPRHSLMVLLTDGEEHGMQGARALVEDPEVRARLKVFVNLEAIGTASPFVLFETGPGTSPALYAWARSSRPRGGSYMQAIYDALPNDTDFSVLKALPGVSGINFAATGDGYTYHTDRDRPDRVTNEVLADAGVTVLDVVDGLDAQPTLSARPTASMYTSVLDRAAFVWSLRSGVTVGWLTAVLGALLWIGVARQLARAGGVPRIVLTLAWATIAAAAVLGALVGAVWLVRTGRAELHPWFASPARLFAFMTAMVVAVSWLVRRLATLAPTTLRPDATPFGVWFAALPAWIVLLVLALLRAPAASYLVFLPLLAVVLVLTPAVLAAQPRTPDVGPRLWPARLASGVVLAATWLLLTPDVVALLRFAVPMLERFPIVTPTWAYPAVFFLFGVLLWPPVLAVLVGRLRYRVGHGLAGALLALIVVVTGLLAWSGPAYTNERPQQRSALFVEDRVRGQAHWELFGNEPGVDIGAGAPANVAWQVARDSAVPAAEIVRKAHLFRGAVPLPADAAPATITATVVRRAGDADIEVTVTPVDREWDAVAFALPSPVVPTRSSLPGRTRGAHWQAWHTTLTPAGLTWRATVPLSQIDRLAQAEVWLGRFRLPGAPAGERVPAWLVAPRTAWMTQHIVQLPAGAVEASAAPETSVPASDAPLPVLVPPATSVPLPTPPAIGSGVPR